MEKANLTVKEFMEYENIGRSTAYELVRDPSFYPAFKIKSKVLINLDMLKKWNAEQSEAQRRNENE